jgi:hypothetical protein
MHLRRNATFNTNLVNGNFLAIANSLATANIGSGFVSTTALPTQPSGRILRNGCDRIASTDPRISLWVRSCDSAALLP